MNKNLINLRFQPIILIEEGLAVVRRKNAFVCSNTGRFLRWMSQEEANQLINSDFPNVYIGASHDMYVELPEPENRTA